MPIEQTIMPRLVADLPRQTLQRIVLGRTRQPGADEAHRLELVPGLKLEPLQQFAARQRPVGAEIALTRLQFPTTREQRRDQPIIERARFLDPHRRRRHAACSSIGARAVIHSPARQHPSASSQRSAVKVSYPSDKT